MTTIVLETEIAAPPEACFDLSLDVDEHVASTAATGERIVAGVMHGRLRLGDTVTFEARHFGLRLRLTSRISEYERPLRFVDEMVSGPLKSVWHEHKFDATAEGTRMTDTFRFAAPLGPLGALAERLFLGRHMTTLRKGRNLHLKASAESRR